MVQVVYSNKKIKLKTSKQGKSNFKNQAIVPDYTNVVGVPFKFRRNSQVIILFMN